MQGIIVPKPKMTLVGMACRVTLEDNHIMNTTQELARQFMNRRDEIPNQINKSEVLGLSTDPENYNPSLHKFEYFIGVEVSSIEDLPQDMIYREIPMNEYIVFTIKGTADAAGLAHDYLYSNWLNNNDYELSDQYNIEIYDERHQGPESEESITNICFPIRKKGRDEQ